MSNVLQGLSLSLFGLLITFAFLGLLILVIVILREGFKVPPKEALPDERQQVEDNKRKKAVGVAVAVAMLKSKSSPGFGLGQVLETPPSRWWGDARIRGNDGYRQSENPRQSK